MDSHQLSGWPNTKQTKIGGWLAVLHLDLPLLTGLILLSSFGLLVLYSANGQDMELIYRQLVRLGVAFLTMFIFAQLHPEWMRRYSIWLYAISMILLVAVLMVGDFGKGSQRWLEISFLRFQPSELFKLAMPIMIAWLLAEESLPPKCRRLVFAGVLILLPTLLIAKQPDLGTSILVANAGLFVLFFACLSWRFFREHDTHHDFLCIDTLVFRYA